MVTAASAAVLVALVAVLAVLYGQQIASLLPFLKIMESAQAKNRTVIVVGGGLAGMSAALEAAQNGATVILIDKEKAYVIGLLLIYLKILRTFPFATRSLHDMCSARVFPNHFSHSVS